MWVRAKKFQARAVQQRRLAPSPAVKILVPAAVELFSAFKPGPVLVIPWSRSSLPSGLYRNCVTDHARLSLPNPLFPPACSLCGVCVCVCTRAGVSERKPFPWSGLLMPWPVLIGTFSRLHQMYRWPCLPSYGICRHGTLIDSYMPSVFSFSSQACLLVRQIVPMMGRMLNVE